MDAYFLAFAGLAAIYDYVLRHTLFCLVPAFFIAGAMAALVPKNRILKYLGRDSPKRVAYPLAVVAGLLLAVCSCTILPLFAGIRKRGAGIGPALALLYTAPATNIVAVLYTGSLIGWDIAAARIGFSVLFAVATGLIIARMFGEDGEKEGARVKGGQGASAGRGRAGFAGQEEKEGVGRLLLLFGSLVAILIVGTRVEEALLKYGLTLLLVGAVAFIAKKYFSKEEIGAWMGETWGFAKTIFPLLLLGVFLSGIIREAMPQDFVASYVGNNSLFAVIIPVIFGILVYFPTLVEVPMARTFLDLGMAKGPLLAYLLSDSVISLPSILVVRKIIGNKRALAYVLLIFGFSVAAGVLYGRIAG